MNYDMLFKAIINDGCKNKEDLINAGFTQREIDELVNDGIITLEDGLALTYIVMPDLYSHARYLFRRDNTELGIKYMEYVCTVCPKDMDYLKELFLMYLSTDINKAFACFDKLYHSEYWKGKNHFTDNHDMKFIMLLFSCIIKLPEEYKRKINAFTFNDIACNHPDATFNYTMNNIRGSFYTNIFNVAAKKIKATPKDDPLFSTYNMYILRIFNYLIKGFDIKNRERLCELINQNRYEEAYDFASELLNNYKCDVYYHHIHDLLGTILGKIKPIEQDTPCTSFYDALNKKNYKEAKRLSTESTELTKLIDEVLTPKVDINKLYDTFVDNLISNKIDKALVLLNKYLIEISKSEYEELLIDLIRYNVYIGDKMHANVMLALTMIKTDNFRMDLTECYKEFYKRVNMHDFEGAKLLLEVIKEAAFILRKDIDINSLMIMLDDASKYDKYFDALNNQDLMCSFPYNEETAGVIKEANSKGIKSVIIGDDKNKKLVLVKSTKVDENEMTKLLEKLEQYIKKSNFTNALTTIQKIISGSPKLNVTLMIKYTIILNELGMKKSALEAFRISKTLGAEENFDYNFNELLISITGKPEEKEEDKLTFMQIVHFDKDYEDLFDMVALKVSDDNISVTKACTTLGFDTFSTGIVLLIYAKKYYMQHDEKKGNEFMEKFNRLPGKDAKLREYSQNLKSMKNVYLNRATSGNKIVLVKA